MICSLTDKKVEVDYSFYSAKIRLKCPFCAYRQSQKTITFTTLRQLVFHLSNQHRNEGNLHPFSVSDIKFLMQMIALAKEWRLLD